jgi:hypothetical protein
MHALQQPATRERMGANARNAMLPLTSAAMTSRLLALYSDLLANRRHGADPSASVGARG